MHRLILEGRRERGCVIYRGLACTHDPVLLRYTQLWAFCKPDSTLLQLICCQPEVNQLEMPVSRYQYVLGFEVSV